MDNFNLDDFLAKLDTGFFDSTLEDAIGKLTRPQLEQLATTLMKRDLKHKAKLAEASDSRSRSPARRKDG